MSSPLAFMLYDSGFNPGDSTSGDADSSGPSPLPPPFEDTSSTESNALVPASSASSASSASAVIDNYRSYLNTNASNNNPLTPIAIPPGSTTMTPSALSVNSLLPPGGDPEAYVAAQASTAMEPITGPYLHDVFTGQKFTEGMNRYFGPQPPYNPDDPSTLGPAMNIAMSFGPGTMAGEKAMLEPAYASKLEDLDRFKALEKQGNWPSNLPPLTKTQLFDATGIFRSADGDVRFIIPEEKAKLNFDNLDEHVNRRTGKITYSLPDRPDLKLGDIYDHPDLYAGYPHMKDMPVEGLDNLSIDLGHKGGYDPVASKMYLAPGSAPDLMSAITHEGQHAVQEFEDHGIGGSPRQFLPPNYDKERRAAEDAYDDLDEEMKKYKYDMRDVGSDLGLYPYGRAYPTGRSAGLPQDIIDRYTKVSDELNRLGDIKNQAYRNYRSLSGEIEASAAQAQLHQRNWSRPPEETGVFEADIFRGGGDIEPYPTGPQIVNRRTPAPSGYYHIYNPRTQQFHIGEHMPDGFDPFAPGGGGEQ